MAHNTSSPRQVRHSYQSMLPPTESPPCSPGARSIHRSTSSQSSMPLAIRGTPINDAPPPLAPPRHIATDTRGLRSSWKPEFQGSGKFDPGSSLFGNSPARHSHKSSISGDNSMNSPLHRMTLAQGMKQEDDPTPLPPIVAGLPLEAHNHHTSTLAYDKQLLNKIGSIGRPKTPSRSSTLPSSETSPVNSGLPLRLDTQPAIHRLTLAEKSYSAHPLNQPHPDSPFKPASGFGARWMPQPGTVSPSMISSSASTRSLSQADILSPSSYDPSTAPSSLNTDTFSRYGSIDRGSNASLSRLSSLFEDPEREKTRQMFERRNSEMGRPGRPAGGASYEQAVFPGDEPGPSELTGHSTANGPRALYENPHAMASEAALHDAGGPQGIKRKASPTPGDVVGDQPPPLATRSRTPARTSRRTSPGRGPPALPPASYGSVPSAQASPYAASNAAGYVSPGQYPPSAVAGSLGPDTERRHSTASYGHPATIEVSSSLPLPGHVQQISNSVQASSLPTEAGPTQSARDGGIVAAHIHVCDCCPKKPKKFNTLEELKNHQREKQFYCQYCHNRFKNKNEAERHQNSLHLRKQSWSCAALGNKIDRAFHPCTATPSVNPQQPTPQPAAPPAESDICGYCGKSFPNFPSPDWADRNKHLTEVHKFGECNQAKKFFRADHFRQHLKHSHQGSSGKWTNMLEQACLREEQIPEILAVGEGPIPLRAQPQQQASQALQAVSQQVVMPAYQIEALQAAAPPVRQGLYTSAIAAGHVHYEPKIEEEDEPRR